MIIRTAPRAQGAELSEHERAENFPVALGLLPRRVRGDLRAVYRVVRVIDELGDSATGDRVAKLEHFAADLSRVWLGGDPESWVLQQLVPTARRRGLAEQPFQDLITANLRDQHVTSYRTFPELLEYCRLSAAPIGRLVLQIFDADTAAHRERSDAICAGLQLVEHWQDVAEDRRAGRIYLPGEDMAHFGVAPEDLDAVRPTPALRQLIFFETDRAAALLDAGAPLVGELHGWARIAVAGYLAGGRAAVDSVHRAQGNVLLGAPRVRRRDVLTHALAELRWAR